MTSRPDVFRQFLILVISLVIAVPAAAIELTPGLQIKVADTFLSQGEYYRAVTEYRRFSILFPDSALNDQALYSVGKAYLLGGEYQKAISSWQDYRRHYPDTDLVPASHYQEALALWKMGDLIEAENKFYHVTTMISAENLVPRAIGARVLLAIEQRDPDTALLELERLVEHGYPLTGAREKIIAYKQAERKSPLTAALMSTLLPGSGHVYAGRKSDGFSAFFVNAVFIYAAIEAFDRDSNTSGYLLASFGLPFYVGNIYGAANAAHNHNKTIENKLREQIFLHFDFVF